MKKLISFLAIAILTAIPFSAFADDATGPVVTEAVIQPAHATAGETVTFLGRAEAARASGEELRMGIFYLAGENWIPVTPLHYLPEKDIFVASITIPERIPNAVIPLYFIAFDANGTPSEPVERNLTIYSMEQILIAEARGCLISDTAGAVKNFHRGEANTELPFVEKGLTVRVGTVLLFQSVYEGVWYDEANGAMGTTIRLYYADGNNEWHLIDSDRYRSDIIDGAALRHGTAQVMLPCTTTGEVMLKLEVVSAVYPTNASAPIVDADAVVFRLTVVGH